MQFDRIRRREFITLLGVAAAATMVGTRASPAQPSTVPLIGFLSGTSVEERERVACRDGLAEFGYVEGKNVRIEYRSADGQYDRIPALAAELVRRQVAVIFAGGGTITPIAAKTATATIPIVFAVGGDPVKVGLVSSLNRPGGNVTGVSFLISALAAKRVELLRDLIPTLASVGFLANPGNANLATELPETHAAARQLGLQFHVQYAANEAALDAAFSNFAGLRVDSMTVNADAYFLSRRNQISQLAAQHRIPAIYPIREQTVADGLISYGPSRMEAYRQACGYVGKILKGENPANLPVVQSTKFELVINLKTAKALGLTVPPTLIARADEVIE